MYLSVAICNDDAENIFTIKEYLEQFELEYDIDFSISLFTSGEKLLSQHNNATFFHLIFLGTEMQGKNGLETATVIRSRGDFYTKIIFISSQPDYMQDSFNVQAFHYLMTPITYPTFCNIMQRIIIQYQTDQTVKFLIQHDGTEELVNINDITYIEALKPQKRTLHFALKDRSIYCKGILQRQKEELERYNFVTSCRGFLVNMRYILFINKTSITLTTGAEIPLSRRCDREIHRLFMKHIITLQNY